MNANLIIVYSRDPEHIKILHDPTHTPKEIRAWAKALFLSDPSPVLKIPTDVLKWGMEIMVDCYKEAQSRNDSDSAKRVLDKILHTKEVVEAGSDIIAGETGIDWDHTMATLVCFLHDIGRFPQALLGSFSDSKTGFDHAMEGVKMISSKAEAKYSLKTFKTQDLKILLEAIEWHSRIRYEGKNLYSKFIRDADKLALVRTVHYWLKVHFPLGLVSPQVLEYMQRGELVDKDFAVTKADFCMLILAWKNDLNFKTTRELVRTSGAIDWMLERIRDDYREILNDSYEEAFIEIREAVSS